MARRFILSATILACIAIAAAGSARAQWVKDGVGLCLATGPQYNIKATYDMNGGAIVAWMDVREITANTRIYAQRVDAGGRPLWAADGIRVCTNDANEWLYDIVSDGAGGAIVLWQDQRAGRPDIYAQRIDGDGNRMWAADGLGICTFDQDQWDARLVPDGAGGAIVVWTDNRGGNPDIYAQRVNAFGAVLWTVDGVPVCDDLNSQYSPVPASDGAGGAIVVWPDYRYGDADIFGQRIDGTGALLWDAGGMPVCTEPESQYGLKIAAHPAGGAYVAWNDIRSGYNDCYIQRIDGSGTVLWSEEGLPVLQEYWNRHGASIVNDLYGGVIAVWYDDREDTGALEVWAQRFDGDGNPLWGSYGNRVFDTGGEGDLAVSHDDLGGVIVAIDAYHEGPYLPTDIYVQRLDGEGAALWGPRGAGACVARDYQFSPVLLPDGSGGAFVFWDDMRASGSEGDIYAQRIGPEGLWGDPEPEVASCLDVPNDQGGWVRIRTRASSHDVAGEYGTPIAGYNVWRMIEGGGPMSALGDALPRLLDPTKAVGVRLDAAQAASLGLPEGDWESVGFWFATRDTVYNIAVPTRNDSTEAGPAEETYIVTAHTSTAGIFVASEPATGYSVDNLAPGMTGGFAGDEVASPPGLRLSWAPNPASDLWKYDVHRGDDAGFVPDASNRIATTEGAEYHDGEWIKSYMYFYKLVAVDRHGNPSPAALLRPEDINVGALLQSCAATLAGSFVEIAWTVSEAGADARFTVLRAEGGAAFAELAAAAIEREGLSFVCTDRGVEPGTTYRYRVDVSDASGRRTLFETDAIAVPAMPLALRQNHPNPFNPSTSIGYYLPAGCAVTLEIYDSSGKLVARLLDGETQGRGTHSVEWRGTDGGGRSVSSGVYFYRLRAGRETLSRKMVLLR